MCLCVCGGVGTLVVLQGSVCVCVWRGGYLCSFTRFVCVCVCGGVGT